MTTPSGKTYVAMSDNTKCLIEGLYYGKDRNVSQIASMLGWPEPTIKQHIKVVDDRLEQRKVKLETLITESEQAVRELEEKLAVENLHAPATPPLDTVPARKRGRPQKDPVERELKEVQGNGPFLTGAALLEAVRIDAEKRTKEQEIMEVEKKNELGDIAIAKDEQKAKAIEELKKYLLESTERSAAKAESDRLKKICFPVVSTILSNAEIMVSGFNSYMDGNGIGQISITIQTAGV